MEWSELTKEQQDNFMDWVTTEYTIKNGYDNEQILDFINAIKDELYYIDEGLTYQY